MPSDPVPRPAHGFWLYEPSSCPLTPMLALYAFQTPPELDAYLRKRDLAYAYRSTYSGKVSEDTGQRTIDLTSGKWHGALWRHQVIFRPPSKLAAPGVGILYITGDGPTKGDYTTLGLVAEGTGMPVAMLFDEPNQPLFDGKREDDLIAYTFQRYLETGDASWPLLFPMTRAALRAMDAVQALTKDTANPITRFVVCGASKRGWTTWLVGASGDKRVIGIAPMVYENLNLQAQMPHQLDVWGAYSPMIEDYTKRGLQAALATPRGQRLGAMIDPYSYRDRITMPALLIRGSNDPYWTVDALDQYERGLKMPHWTLDVPNASHDLKGGFMAAESIGAFARSLAGGPTLPKLDFAFTPMKGEVSVRANSEGVGYRELKVWVAESDTLDFRDSKYENAGTMSLSETLPSAHGTVVVPLTPGKNHAVFAECRYVGEGRAFSLSSPTRVYRK